MPRAFLLTSTLVAVLVTSGVSAAQPPPPPGEPPPPPPAGPPPIPHLEFEISGLTYLDRRGVDEALKAGHYTALPKFSLKTGGRLSFEIDRFYIAGEMFDVEGSSGTSGLQSVGGMLDIGWRLCGSPRKWGIIPMVGLGASDTTLTFGQADPSTSFAEALRSRGPMSVRAVSFVVHTGAIWDFLVFENPRTERGFALGMTGGLLSAPASSGWKPLDASGYQAQNRSALTGGPPVPGTGPYVGGHMAFSF